MRHAARRARHMDSAFERAAALDDPSHGRTADRDFEHRRVLAALLAGRIAPLAPKDSAVLARTLANRALAGTHHAHCATKLRLGRRDCRLSATGQGLWRDT